MNHFISHGLLCVAFFWATTEQIPAAAPAKEAIDFNAQIRPILSTKCFHCHGPDEGSRKAKLRLDLREEATKERSEGKFAIKPNDLERSELARRIASKDPDEVMPPPKEGHALKTEEIALLKKWIQQGAPYAQHWAFIKPERPALPKNVKSSLARSPIDAFIASKLKEAKLKPSPPATRYALIRRLSLDLTGLPPTPTEVNDFVNDKSPKAYEKAVDRLLASPAYGEKWARMWLDIARYADSQGYGSDALRLNIWPYRDWLIKALNQNMPYDQFTLEQIAGDLLDHPTEDQLVATAFHRNTMTNTEGGTDDEEWRVAAVKDRANVTAQAWMGLTMGCAQCHTHKFDPITQKEYYQFYAFFNQTEDTDQPDDRPLLPLPTKSEREKMDTLKNEIAALEKKLETGSPEMLAELSNWEKFHMDSNAWKTLEPIEFKSMNGTVFTKLEDGSLLAGTNSPEKDIYTVTTRVEQTNITAIRLDVLSDASLPANGPGRSAYGNFVLNNLKVTSLPENEKPTFARFLRIELPGEQRILSLAEVQVFHGETNLAKEGKASQSSTDYEGPPEYANDGNTNGELERKSTTHTKTENNPWWEVDLGAEKTFDAVAIWNRTDGGVEDRLSNFRVIALDAARTAVWETKVSAFPKPSVRLATSGERTLALRNPSADYSQKNFDVSEAIDGKADKKSGWGVAGETGKAHTAIFEIVGGIPRGTLIFQLDQNFGGKSTIGRFKLSITDLPVPVLFIPTNISSILVLPPTQRSADQQQQIISWYQQHALANAEIRKQITGLKAKLDDIKPASVPVMRELAADKRRTTRLMSKGSFLAPGDEVSPGIPAAFNSWPANAPTNRIGVARWLMSPENPLTARVAANRIWSQIFGTGIVETEEDFGTQGSLPSHPELLDWLALEFRDGGWDMKKFIKTIVTSATYQQTSRVTPELLQKDPRNRLLSRAPRSRLDAEMVHDQALALGGLLGNKIGGPSVYPMQPDGLWRAAFNGQRTYATSMGEDRYRRGLYTIWRRTIPYPSMATFDAPSRENCTFRRLPTNTPLQAYVTMNDPVYVEASQALGRRLLREGGATVEEKIRFGLRLVLARAPEKSQVTALVNLLNSELAHYRTEEKDAVKLATQPLGPLPEGMNAAEVAAWTVVANVLLNLDGVLTKG